MKAKALVLLVTLSLVLVSGCVSPDQPVNPNLPLEIQAQHACMNLCREAVSKGLDISSGPCLADEIAPDWVCDVAHRPRTAEDDRDENQCPAFGVTASRFVEVDLNCNLITSS